MRLRIQVVLVVIWSCMLVGCGSAVQPTSDVRSIVVGMPFIPNVQFAHFYVAEQEGYFADEGLSVTFDYNFENDVVQRIATNNQITFALASADSILLARSKGLPVRAVMATTQAFPIGFISKSDTGITTIDDLRGKTIGIPGRFGASYIGLQAILRAGNLTEDDVRIQEIGFTQVAALREDNVDVVSGYINNEPIQLRNAGVNVNVLAVSELYPLASDHLIVSEQTLSTDRILVEKFTRALLRGMNRVNEDPDAAFTVALSAIPEANRVDPMLGVAILKETVRLWQPENFGVIQEPNWANTQRLLIDMKLISADVSLTDAYDTSFVSR